MHQKNCPSLLYRNIARTISQSDAPSSWRSCFDGDGCTALAGSDAGKLSIKPDSGRACASRSAAAAARGLAACLSCAAGSNFSAMSSLRGGITPAKSECSDGCNSNTVLSDRHRPQCTESVTRLEQDFFTLCPISHRQVVRVRLDYLGDGVTPSSLRQTCGVPKVNSNPSPFGISSWGNRRTFAPGRRTVRSKGPLPRGHSASRL